MSFHSIRRRVNAVVGNLVGKLPARSWLPIVGLIVAACITASEVPKPAALNSLVPKDADSQASDNAFAIVHHGPVDAATSDATINIVFSRAIRALDASDDDAPIPVTLTPAVEGKWHWVGTHGVQFQPKAGRLPLGTQFKVSVPATVTALTGEQLGKPFEFAFFTPAPRLEAHVPYDGATGLSLKPEILLGFNQPIDPSELATKLTLHAGSKTVAYDLSLAEPKDGKSWAVIPKAALPRNTQIQIELQPGLHSIGGGDVASPHARSFSFHTYGPLTATARCGWSECSPEATLTIELTNAVPLSELRQRLSITPAARLDWPDWYDADTTYTSYSVNFKGAPRTTYQLQIGNGLRDEYKQELRGPQSFSFTTTDYWSSLNIGVSGQILQPASIRAVPVRSRNVASYDLTTSSLTPPYVFQAQTEMWHGGSFNLPKILQQRVSPGITNRFHDHLIDLTPSLGVHTAGSEQSLRGAVLIESTYPSADYQNTDRKLVQVTDLGLTAKLSKQGTLVWVTRMSTGQPLAGATVELWSDQSVTHSYTTDKDGFVTIPASDYVPQFYGENRKLGFVARYQGDYIAQAESTFMGPWRMPVYPELYPRDTKTTYMFTERGVYRPGDKVWVKGIVRDDADTTQAAQGGMVVVANRRFELQLFDPNNTVIATQPITTTAFGTFAHQLSVPASASLGSFRVALKDPVVDDSHHELPTTYFSVAEYEPSEFSVTSTVKEPSYVSGATATFTTQSSFLYGAPVAGGDFNYTLTYEPSAFTPAIEGFETTDHAYQWELDSSVPQYGLIAQAEGKLDGSGQTLVQQPLSINGQNGPLNIRFESSVSDVSRKTISASAQTVLHPADYYLGIQHLEDWFVPAPGSFEPRIVALTPKGKRVAGKRVDLELIRRRWASVREVWEGGYRQVYRRLDDVVSKCSLNTTASEQSCALALTEGGNYLVRAKSVDDAGRAVYASMEFYAIGNARADWRDDAVNAHMDLVPNKKVYKVGETARILVKSPFQSGDALVTVERAGIIEKRRMTLTGGTPVIEVPITDAMRPNAFVSVHLLKKRNNKSAPATSGDELYRIGYTQLTLDASQRKLDVTVTPKVGTVRPRDKVVVDVQVKDASGKGKASEVTFYAVDEGVLMLTGYQLPDPVSKFTAPRPLTVATIESRSDLARIFEPLAPNGSEKGAEGGDGGGARSDFKQSAYFNPNVLTDDTGRARVEFVAPDNLTTFRLMAVAVSKDDRYGGGQSQVVVNKPLMARPALPRFLRAGDRFEAAVAISTKAAKSKTVDVAIKVDGGLELQGKSSERISVTPEGVREVRFPVVAQTTGEGSITFTLRGESESDSVILKRTIHTPAQIETVAAYGETRGVDGQRLGKLEQVRPDVGGLQVSLASSRLVGLNSSMETLVDYPYYCTEQLSSRLLPVLPLRDLATEFGFEPMPDARGFAERTVRLIVERQRHDGGFGFWSESLDSHPFVSAYALWTLELASKHGVKVNAEVFKRGLTYLRSIVNHPSTDPAELEKHGLSRDLQAFSTMVMGALGAPDLGAIERLLEQRKEIGLLGHAWLLTAAVNAKADAALRKPLVTRLESAISVVGNRAVVANADGRYLDSLFASPLKVQALVLDALLSDNPKHPMAGKLVAEVLAQREGGSWRTTQESAFALLAIDRYWKSQEKERPQFEAKVWVGDKPLLQHAFQGRSTKAVVSEVSMATLQANSSLDVVFERGALSMVPASGTLFYEARLQYGHNEAPRAPLDRGFAVQKTIRAVTPSELASAVRSLGSSASSIDAKQLAVIDLLVVAPNARRFVVIDDPIPAGLAAFDSSLATSSEYLAEAESDEVASSGFSRAWSRRELRDDRALFFVDDMPSGLYHFRYLARPHTPGTYVVPPTRASEMYQPELYGRTAASTLTVTANLE